MLPQGPVDMTAGLYNSWSVAQYNKNDKIHTTEDFIPKF